MQTFQKILLVDDDGISNFITEKLILREEFAREIINFTSGEDALAYLKQAIKAPDLGFPNLILLDLNMPGMDGWDFIEEYKKLPQPCIQRCHLYMLSSAVDAKDIVHAKTISLVEDFISKPLTKEDIDVMRERHFGTEPIGL